MSTILINPKDLKREIAGKGYIRFPRFISDAMFSYNRKEQDTYHVYALLLILSRHTPGKTEFKKQIRHCEAGEILISCRNISDRTRIPSSNVDCILKELEEQGLIVRDIQHPGQRIRVNHYKELTHDWWQQEKHPSAASPSTGSKENDNKEALEENKRLFQLKNQKPNTNK